MKKLYVNQVKCFEMTFRLNGLKQFSQLRMMVKKFGVRQQLIILIIEVYLQSGH